MSDLRLFYYSPKNYINNIASLLNTSSGAIAGAMAEEGHSYFEEQWLQDQLDDHAQYHVRHGVKYVRSHEYWVTAYETYDPDTAPSKFDKLSNPIAIDVGHGNFKIGTAIRLIQSDLVK